MPLISANYLRYSPPCPIAVEPNRPASASYFQAVDRFLLRDSLCRFAANARANRVKMRFHAEFEFELPREENLKRNSLRILAIASGAAVLLLFLVLRAPSTRAQNSADWSRLSAEKSLGSPNASIRIDVFSDYECPACDNFYEGTLRPMIDDYVASGKVYLVHHDFPLPMHKYSREAARWANAAARIGHFEAVDRALYDNQAAWTENGPLDGQMEKFVRAALTPSEFKRVEVLMKGCVSTSHADLPGCAVDAGIQHDIAEGELLPITQTPTFIVTYRGQKYPPAAGVISWPLMKQFLDQLLSHK